MAYVGNLARQVDSTYNINAPDPGPGTPASRRPLRDIAPGVVNVTWGDTTGNSNYHALQVAGERRFSGGLGFLSSYTYAHSIDNVPLQQGGGADGPIPQDIRYRFLDRASSAFNIRHQFTQSLNYTLPVGAGQRLDLGRGWANQAFGGWQVNLIVFTRSGLPFTPTLATSVSNAGGSRPDRLKQGDLGAREITRWFDTSFNTADAAWATPRQFTYGNSGRNVLNGPGRTNIDFSVFKEFSLTEDARLQFRAEFFNLFNHPQFDLPNSSIGSPSAGRISSTVGTPRDIQFSLRVSF